MPGAFYRNTSSSGKKAAERERRAPSLLNRDEAGEADARSVPLPEPIRDEKRSGGMAWTARITPSALVTASVLALILLTFSFLCGIIVGRGTMPLPQPQELKHLLPAEAAGEEGTEEGKASEAILPKEELRFMTSLKSEQDAGVLSERSKAENAPVSGEEPKNLKPETVSEKAKAEVVEPQKPLTDYVIRVAAFKNAEQAQSLRSRLAKAGLRARYAQTKTKRGTWHYVQVLLRGTDTDFQKTKSILNAEGLRDFMILSRKPVKN